MKYTRRTSSTVYRQIREEGLLSKRRLEVYDVLYKKGPMTARQVIKHLNLRKTPGDRGSYNSRFSELRNMGAIKEIGEGECPESGRYVIFWDVTSKLPVKLNNTPKKRCKECGAVVRGQ